MSDEDDVTTGAPGGTTRTTTTAAPTPPAADPGEPYAEDDPRRRIELLAAVLLGLAGILTAVAAFRAAQTGGDELLGLTEASQAYGDSNSYYAEYTQTYNADMALFLEYEVQLFDDKPEVAETLRQQFFSDNLNTATEAWIADEGDTSTPLEMDEYATPDYDSYEEQQARAEERTAFAKKAADAGDRFDQASVFLALSLFFAGIAALLKRRPIQYAGLIGSAVFMVPGIIAIVSGQSIATG